MKLIFTILLTSILSFSSLANGTNEGQTVRYKGVFYTVVYEGSDYTTLINDKTGERKIVVYSK